MTLPPVRIGCAGWALNAAHRVEIPGDASHLERYATRFNCVEINSSFYRAHLPKTYATWAGMVPADFRFAVKLPRAITHEARLADSAALLDKFLAEIAGLGEKCGPVLVQLPPKLALDETVAETFFADLRRRFNGDVVCEPRHASWFEPAGERLLARHRIARVAADPPPDQRGMEAGGWEALAYFRLHGSPEVYRSKYGEAVIEALARRLVMLRHRATPAWVIFDNTMLGHAFFDASALKARLAR